MNGPFHVFPAGRPVYRSGEKDPFQDYKRRAGPKVWSGAGARVGAGIPPGITVDELRWFSRRRPNDTGTNRDNLCVESGSLKDVTSEYGYSFRSPGLVARSLVNLASHVEDEKENFNIRRCLSHSEDLVGKSLNRANHRFRYRPQGDLRPEGDMLFQTEKRDQFIEYVLSKRPDLLRRDTELKLEGDLNTLTENRDKFILFDNYERPPLVRRDTNLHLEGDYFHTPEYKDVFVEFPRHRPITKKPDTWLHTNHEDKMDFYSETLSQFITHAIAGTKPEILRRPSNLKCEGDLDFMPEYTKSYKQFPIERRPSLRQNSHLKLEGELYTTPEYKDKYIGLPIVKQQQTKHVDTFVLNDDSFKTEQYNTYIPSHADPPNVSLKPEGSLPMSTDNTTQSDKPPTPRRSVSPQILRSYLDDYKTPITDKSRNVPKPSKPSEERVTSRPPIRSRHPRTSSQSLTGTRNDRGLISKAGETTAHDTNYHDRVEQKSPRQMKPSDKHEVDEKFECQPEYRKAYTDYLIRERLPRHRSPENVEGKSPVNLKWIKRGDHREPPFEVLCTKGTAAEERRLGPMKDENSFLYKPSSRRASVSSIQSPRRRSDSPSYRLHVTNVDEPKKGFGSRGNRRPSKGYHNTESKPPSPTRQQNEWNVAPRELGRRQWQKNTSPYENDPVVSEHSKNKSFVVLDRNNLPDQARNTTFSRWYRHSND